MTGRIARTLPLIVLLGLGGCELVGDVLAVGFWAGVVLMVIVLGLIWILVRAFRR